jgi:hypothetical protein
MALTVTPMTFREACAFVERHHRHHPPPVGDLFRLGLATDLGTVVGVAMVGRPVARMLQDGLTCEVIRTCTDGTRNANSALYAASWRAARALGWRRLITYTQAGESGASLRGAGWRVIAKRPARAGWTCPSRPRVDTAPVGVQRTLWEAV